MGAGASCSTSVDLVLGEQPRVMIIIWPESRPRAYEKVIVLEI